MNRERPALVNFQTTTKPRFSEFASYGLIAASVWLAWEVVKAPVAQRAPPAIAARISPSSPEVLRRAAEGELSAGREENATVLAEEALRRAPFDARSLRVRGLATAQMGDEFAADQMLTLAGNWSLRDDPAHGWLVEYRLRRGDYGSSFAHADTLARRRPDLHPKVFDLFTTASTHDQRAFRSLVRLVDATPPWRAAYWKHLRERPDADSLALSLAIALEGGQNPLSNGELSALYRHWAKTRRYEAVRYLQRQLDRPDASKLLQNGDYSAADADQILPLAWEFGRTDGLEVEVSPDDIDPRNPALRIDFHGQDVVVAAVQQLLLPPGSYTFSGRRRVEAGREDRLRWRVSCILDAEELAMADAEPAKPSDRGWQRFSIHFTVPADRCPAQTLSLMTRPADRTSGAILWFDDLMVRPRSVAEH